MTQSTALLNDVQLRVLRWVKQGCPDGIMQGSSYKTTALALQNRGLAKVSKRGGIWRCDITQAGAYYLHHGNYPPGFAPPNIVRIGGAIRHPALKVLDGERELENVSPKQRMRAMKILQSLCELFTSEGIAVRGNSRSGWHRAGSPDRALIQADAGHQPVGIDLREHSNRSLHIPSTKEAALPSSSAYMIPRYDYTPNGKLYFVLGTGVSQNWEETNRRPMEERLVDIVQAVRQYSLNVVRYQQREQERQLQAAAEWEIAHKRALRLHTEASRVSALKQQVEEWRELAELDQFIDAMASHLRDYDPGAEREAGERWLAWVREHRRTRDPFRSIAMPAATTPTPADLLPYMGQLSPYGPPR